MQILKIVKRFHNKTHTRLSITSVNSLEKTESSPRSETCVPKAGLHTSKTLHPTSNDIWWKNWVRSLSSGRDEHDGSETRGFRGITWLQEPPMGPEYQEHEMISNSTYSVLPSLSQAIVSKRLLLVGTSSHVSGEFLGLQVTRNVNKIRSAQNSKT